MVQPPFMIFQNKDRNYPTHGVNDDVPSVSYRTGPKDWISRRTMLECTLENRALPCLPDGRRRILVMNNFSSHGLNDELRLALEKINMEILFIPANAIHLLHPADLFVIPKIK